jgi:hypothetical protein
MEDARLILFMLFKLALKYSYRSNLEQSLVNNNPKK